MAIFCALVGVNGRLEKNCFMSSGLSGNWRVVFFPAVLMASFFSMASFWRKNNSSKESRSFARISMVSFSGK